MKFLRKHTAGSEEVWRAKVRKLSCKIDRRLDRLVEPLAKPAADGCVELDFVYEFSPRFVVEANRVHL